MPIINDIEFNFKLSPITTLKMQKIAVEYGLDSSQLGSVTGMVAIAACASNPDLVLNMGAEELSDLQEKIKECPEYKTFEKEMLAPAKKLKTSNQKKQD